VSAARCGRSSGGVAWAKVLAESTGRKQYGTVLTRIPAGRMVYTHDNPDDDLQGNPIDPNA